MFISNLTSLAILRNDFLFNIILSIFSKYFFVLLSNYFFQFKTPKTFEFEEALLLMAS